MNDNNKDIGNKKELNDLDQEEIKKEIIDLVNENNPNYYLIAGGHNKSDHDFCSFYGSYSDKLSIMTAIAQSFAEDCNDETDISQNIVLFNLLLNTITIRSKEIEIKKPLFKNVIELTEKHVFEITNLYCEQMIKEGFPLLVNFKRD